MFASRIPDLVGQRALQWIAPDATIRSACRQLSTHRIGALAVCAGGRLVGILSERDIVSRVAAAGRPMDETTVAEAMTPDPVTIDRSAGVAEALTKMLDGHFRHLPVLEDGRPVGMLSMRDIPAENRVALQHWREWRDGTPADELGMAQG